MKRYSTDKPIKFKTDTERSHGSEYIDKRNNEVVCKCRARTKIGKDDTFVFCRCGSGYKVKK